jgi:hypothetical protein
MIRPSYPFPAPSLSPRLFSRTYAIPRTAAVCLLLLPLCGVALGQAITIDTRTGNVSTETGTVDRRFAQIKPTSVELSKSPLDSKTRLALIRLLQSEQGWAMRPFPRGHKGLSLQANGNLKPVGEGYLEMVTQFGLCAKPGDAVVVTDIKFDKNKIVFQINGGPDLKHRFLRHIEIGAGGATTPVVQDPGDGSDQPIGARITLQFEGPVPELTGSQVKALLSPLISFDVKTPVQAFTDTLPPQLKEAILNHNVWVGMSTDMVLFAKGAPERKVREVEGQIPFEEWIYGQPPQPVEFVRINGNRVIRVEIAKVGETPVIYTKNEVDGLMRTDGTPIVTDQPHTRTVAMGDTHPDTDKQAPAPPPTLVAPGEKADIPQQNGAGAMKPVQFPKQKPDDYPDATNLPRDHKATDNPDDEDKPATPAPDASKTGQSNPTKQPAAAPATQSPATPATPSDPAKPQPND